MELRVPVTLCYKSLNIPGMYDNILSIAHRDDNDNIYLSIANNRIIFKTFMIRDNGSIKVYNDEPLRLNNYQLTPELAIHVKNKNLHIIGPEKTIDIFKNASIVKYVFNPHERIGALILKDNSILRKRYRLVLGFSDNSYTIMEKPLIDVIPYANGFLLAYLEENSVVIEKISTYEKRQYDIGITHSLKLTDSNDFISLMYDKGTLIVDRKNLKVIEKTHSKNMIPLGQTRAGLILWNTETHGIYHKDMKNNKVILICENKPSFIGFLKGKAILKCKNSIIELSNNNWRLHESSRDLLGKNIVAATIVGEHLVIGTSNEVFVWGPEKYYFKPEELLNILKLGEKSLVIVDKKSIGIIDISKQIDPKDIVMYSDTSIDENLRLRKRLVFNNNIVLSDVVTKDNRIIKKKRNVFDLIIVGNKPVTFEILYYGKYKIEHSLEDTSYYFKILSAYIINYHLKGEIIKRLLILRYSYINPFNKDIIKDLYVNNESIGSVKLMRRSKGINTIILPYNPNKVIGNIRINGEPVLVKNINILLQRLSINKIVLNKTNNKIMLSLIITSSDPTKDNITRDVHICIKGFFNGCKHFNTTDVKNNNELIQVPTTIDPRRKEASIVLYAGLNYQYIYDMVVLDETKIPVEADTMSLIPFLYRNKLYIVIDNFPFDNGDLLLITDRIEKIHVDREPYIIRYDEKRFKHIEIKNISALKLYNNRVYYSNNIVKVY